MAAQFYPIRFDEMHEFLSGQGFKWLNPPRGRQLPGCVLPGQVVSVPPAEFYGVGGRLPTLEAVYGRRVFLQGSQKNLTLRIYTTIDAYGARDKGEDAIRVVLFYRPIEVEGGIEVGRRAMLIGGERKCLRVLGWKANIQKRIDKWPEMVGPECPKCGSPTVERDGKRGPFWGCVKWPQCNGIINVGDENKPRCDCGRVMVERTGRSGPFWGCSGYPQCVRTRSLESVA